MTTRAIVSILAAGLLSLGGTRTPVGAQAQAKTPPHRRHHALGYDPVTKRVWLAGGQHVVSNREAPVLTDVWHWDGKMWKEVAASAGAPMVTHKLFGDDRGLLVLLSRGLVARWDGQAWNSIVENSAARRESAACAHDAGRRRFVCVGGLIGGREYDMTGETWAFTGAQWERVATEGPPPMLGGAMAYDTKRQRLVLFGGLNATGQKLGETWEWADAKWVRVSESGPPARFGAGIAFDQARGETVLFGGVDADNRKLNDTWRWNGKAWTSVTSATTPAARSEGYLAYDESRRVTVMFGGEGADVVPSLGDTWEWNGARWTRVQ